nr:hypothetical protein [Tanacetum cinerariifolium]
MACLLSHTDDEVEALVQKLIDEDMVRQKAILDLALQFDSACTAKDDLRKAYKKYEEVLRETLEEQTWDEKEREEKIRQKQAEDQEFMLKFGMKFDSDYDTRVEPSPLTQNSVRIIPGPAGIVQLASSTRVEPCPSISNPVRLTPDHVGIFQQAKLLKERDILFGWDGAVMSTQEYMKKVVEDVCDDQDFKSGSWVSATDYVHATGGIVTGCTIPGIIHHKVIGDGGYGKDISEEFCLVTGLKFGVENRTNYNDEAKAIPFRRRVFSSSLDGRPIRGKHVEELIKSEEFNKLDDNDVVSLCCVGILQLVLLGLEDRRPVSNWILRLANDRDGCDKVDKKSYSITGFAWAFKVYMPINAGGVHWVTEAINMTDSIFYVFDSMESESRMLMLEQQVIAKGFSRSKAERATAAALILKNKASHTMNGGNEEIAETEPVKEKGGFFEKQKLTGPNFIDWYRQLRIVLSIEDKLNYLEQPIPPAPVAPVEPLHAHEMLKELKTLFAQQAEHELLQTTRDFHSCRQEEGQSVSLYVLKMKGYIDNLERLGHPVTLGLGVSLILIGLRKEYDGFVQNYNMHSMGKEVNELHAMLKLHEQTLPKSNAPTLNAI